jgi:hypothetical protein
MGIIGQEKPDSIYSSREEYEAEVKAQEEYAEENWNDLTFRINRLIEQINKMYSSVMTNKEVGHLNTIIESLNQIKEDCK